VKADLNWSNLSIGMMFFHTGNNTSGNKTPLLKVALERGDSDTMISVSDTCWGHQK